ncbi:MAG TPA: FAD-dependent oxidoreductase [Mycobacteriales bacterium]|nr:FAD-dependent oxidoreductase [Mycobacteriales bacterium]
MAPPAGDDPHLVVVGASLAGLRAAEGARRSGFAGPITLLGAEEHLPYDRPPLSKEFLTTADSPGPTLLRDEATLRDDLGITLRLGTEATALDTERRALATDDGEVAFSSLVLATGATPRRLPGADALRGVHVLRTLDDARAIRCALDAGARTVVVGAGFIGSEIAASARTRGCEVTVVEALPTPLARPVGETMGRVLAGLHAKHGTTLRVGVGVEALDGDGEGAVRAVRLADGTTIAAELVVVGIGVTPNVGWLAGSGLHIGDGVECDATLCTGVAGIYAAGDIARWHNPTFDAMMRLEHWTIAAEQGGVAGRNAVDPAGATAFETVPYFWSDWYGKRIQMVGVAAGADEIVPVAGDVDGDSFVVLYRRGERLLGALALEARSQVMKYRALLASGASWEAALTFAKERAAKAAHAHGTSAQL